MINIAPITYSKLQNDGILRETELTQTEIFGRIYYQCAAWINENYLPARKTSENELPIAHAVGTHTNPMIAKHTAISEAVERIAFFQTLKDAPESCGFDYDYTSNGMAAWPSLGYAKARASAHAEATERFLLTSWWLRLIDHENIDESRLPEDVQGLTIVPSNNVKHNALVLWMDNKQYGFRVYGFSSYKNLDKGIERALVEMLRSESTLKQIMLTHGFLDFQNCDNLILKRMQYFASPAGIVNFEERLSRKGNITTVPVEPQIIFDGPIRGFWNKYAKVWRTVIKHYSRRYLDPKDACFFW